jgi:hypothetical protein
MTDWHEMLTDEEHDEFLHRIDNHTWKDRLLAWAIVAVFIVGLVVVL